ncbi:MAG: glycosyltransferase [Proteobacteria bacterium]|nr:glycosyltransferase [Pseudomonadota bacterium]
MESALRQTYTDLEVVVVDNASEDGTWDACQQLAREDERVRVFRNKRNLGPVRNWQRCISEARGRYGKILFSDDVIYPSYLEATVPWLSNSDVGLVYSAVEVASRPGAGCPSYRLREHSALVKKQEFVDAALYTNHVPVSPSAAVFRLESLRENLLVDPPGPIDWRSTGAGPDLLLYLLAAVRHRSVAFVHEALAFFRRHSGSITLSQREQVFAGYAQAWLWFASSHLDEPMRSQVRALFWLRAVRKNRQMASPWRVLRAYGARLDAPGAFVRATLQVAYGRRLGALRGHGDPLKR